MGDSPEKKRNISANVRVYAMFGAGTILARSAIPAPKMGVATVRSGAAKCVLADVALIFIWISQYLLAFNHSNKHYDNSYHK